MNVSLTPELEQYVNGKVQSGRYQTASEVIREGLRLLQEREELHQQKVMDIRREIQVGLDQAERGQVSTFTKATLHEVKTLGRRGKAKMQGDK